MKRINSPSGFSMVELMIVLAIISVIALISIPNLTKNVAKAKQKNAQVELVGIFTQEESFKAEFNTYHDDLTYIGFVPTGIPLDATTRCPGAGTATAKPVDRYYNVGFTTASLPAIGSNPKPCSAAAAGGGSGAKWISYYPAILAGADIGVAPANAVTPDGNTFKAGAVGFPSGNNTIPDEWTMDQNRNLANSKKGI